MLAFRSALWFIRNQMSVDSFLQGSFSFPNFHCAVTVKKKNRSYQSMLASQPHVSIPRVSMLVRNTVLHHYRLYSNGKEAQKFEWACFVTHSEAVNSWLLLVARPLMGLSCPRTSPRGASESACQRRSSPPLHPLSSTGEPGTTPRALTQSAWALADC